MLEYYQLQLAHFINCRGCLLKVKVDLVLQKGVVFTHAGVCHRLHTCKTVSQLCLIKEICPSLQ